MIIYSFILKFVLFQYFVHDHFTATPLGAFLLVSLSAVWSTFLCLYIWTAPKHYILQVQLLIFFEAVWSFLCMNVSLFLYTSTMYICIMSKHWMLLNSVSGWLAYWILCALKAECVMYSFISVNSVHTYCSIEICSVLWITVEPQMKAHTRNQQEVAVNKGWSLMREGCTLNGAELNKCGLSLMRRGGMHIEWWRAGLNKCGLSLMGGGGGGGVHVEQRRAELNKCGLSLMVGGGNAYWTVKGRVEQMRSFFDEGGGGLHIEQWRAEMNKCVYTLNGEGQSWTDEVFLWWGGWGAAHWTVKGRDEQMWS